MKTITMNIVLISAAWLSLSSIAFGQGKEAFMRERRSGKVLAPIVRQCHEEENEEVPLETRISISDGAPPSFARAARKVLRELLGNDLKSFRTVCSDDGLSVVERSREPDLRHSSSEALLLKPNSDTVTATYWVDQDEYFRDRSAIAGDEFKRIFDQIHAIMLDTYGGFDVSTGMWDEWHERFLGPAISAKVCAGTYMYFYLVKERHGWKVWRVEWACH